MCDTAEETNALAADHDNNRTITDSLIVNNYIENTTFIDSCNQDEIISPKSYTNLELGPI